MAQIKIDGSTINAVKNDDIVSLLQKMINEELSKSDEAVNTAFVDECVNALLEIEQDENKGFAVLIPLVSANDYLNRIIGRRHWNALSRGARIAVVAAVMATSTLAANAAVTSITGINPIKEAGVFLYNTFEELTSNDNNKSASPSKKQPEQNENAKKQNEQQGDKESEGEAAKASEKTDGVKENEVTEKEDKKEDKNNGEETKASENNNAPEEKSQSKSPKEEHIVPESIPSPKRDSKSEAPVFSHIEADLKGFKHDYIYGEALTYSGLTVYAVNSDNSREVIALSKCTKTESVDMNKTADYTLRVMYKGSVLKIPITVRPDEETRGSKIGKSESFDYLITDKGVYITAYNGGEANLVLDEINGKTVYAIGASAFEGKEIKSISLPNVKKIFKNAFKNCKQLYSCAAPLTKYIGDSAFEGCEKLQNADAYYASDYLGKSAYAKTGIISITLPSGIKAVPEKLCSECPKLKYVNLSGAQTVKRSAFSDCTALEEVSGTGNLKTVEETAFYGDENAIFETAPSELETVKASAFAYCKSIKFGELKKIKSIDDWAFMYCSGLTAVQLDDEIKTIPQGAFWGCRIKAIALPEGLKRIEAAAFMSTMITKVTIPEKVEYIGARAFQTASSLSVTFEGSPEIENDAFFKSSRLKFFAYEGSSAIEYAIENGIEYTIRERS